MFLTGILLASIMTTHASVAPCKDNLNVISKFAWPIMSTKFGPGLVDEATLASIGRLNQGNSWSKHLVLHVTSSYGGKTYLWGSNRMFLLNTRDQMRELEELNGYRVTDIKFGYDFIVIVTGDGVVWTAGLGQFGQLAQHETQDSPVFNPVTRLPYINPAYRNPSQIAVGNHHVVAMIPGDDFRNYLYSWGFNSDYQQLGYASNETNNPIPREITIPFANLDVRDVCCGSEQCAARVVNLRTLPHRFYVVTWGDSRLIGRPFGDGNPAEVQGIPAEESIDQVACGRTHTLARSRAGRIFAWGSNSHGEILNATSYSDHATELSFEGEVLDVVAGYYTTIIRSDSGVEHFGWYNHRSQRTPLKTNSVVFPRDVMADSTYGPDTDGAVRIGCRAT